VSALYEQARMHHVGTFPQLEDQMTNFTSDFDRKTAGYSPDRVDALVWAMTELLVEPMKGYAIFELYRRQAEAIAAQQAEAKKRAAVEITYAPGSLVCDVRPPSEPIDRWHLC
jgi:hypothetical protein